MNFFVQEYTKKPEMEKVKLDSSSVLVNGFYAAWHAKTQLYHRVQVKQTRHYQHIKMIQLNNAINNEISDET